MRAVVHDRYGPPEVLRVDEVENNREAYDVVVDAVGKHSFMRSRRALKAGGIYVSTDGLHNLAHLVACSG